MNLESAYFIGSNFSGNNLGYNLDFGIVYPEVAREWARRPPSNVPSNLTLDSLQVVVKRFSLLLNKSEDYAPMVVDTFGRIVIYSCRALYEALADTQDNWILATAFTRLFKEASRSLIPCQKQLSFSRCTSMYMHGRWEYDHEYFPQMIEQEQRVNNKAIGAIIINLCKAIQSDLSSKDGSMPGLQERARRDLSSDDNTDSCSKDGFYDDGEPWGCKALTVSQIIGGKPDGMFPNSVLTLYTFSWYGYILLCKNSPVKAKPDFYHAKE